MHLIIRILNFSVLEYCKASWAINRRWRYINEYINVFNFNYFYKCTYNMGPINIREILISYFVIINMTFDALTNYSNLPIT